MDLVNQPPQTTPPVSNESSGRSFVKTLGIGLSIVSFCIALSVGGYLLVLNKNTEVKTACTMEAKLCPDGTSVGRTGPKCEFAPCPTSNPTANWKTYLNKAYNFSFKYPNVWDVTGENSLFVAPKSTIDGIKKMKGGFEGGSFLNIQIKTGEFIAPVSNDYSTVTQKERIINDLTAIEYTSRFIKDVPGFESGAVITDVVFNKNGEKTDVELLDNKNINIFNQILSTFKFTDAISCKTDSDCAGNYICQINSAACPQVVCPSPGSQYYDPNCGKCQISGTCVPRSNKPSPSGLPTNYSCPAPKNIDCMPVISPATRPAQCDPNYRNWINQNCQGVTFTD